MNLQNLKAKIEESQCLKDFFDSIQTSEHIEIMSGWDEFNTDLNYYIHGKLYPRDILWNKKINHLFSFIKTYDEELYQRLQYLQLITIFPLSFTRINGNLHCLKLQLIHSQVRFVRKPEDE